jgi:hypothetical protein
MPLTLISCNKSIVGLHTGTILGMTCKGTAEAAVKLNYKDPLSFTWQNADNGKSYSNVVAVFDTLL